MSIRSWISSARLRRIERFSIPRSSGGPGPRGTAAVLCMALAGVASAPARAQEQSPGADTANLQLYRVEVVIFEQPEAPGRPEDPGRPPLPPAPVDPQTNIPGIFVEQARPLPQSESTVDEPSSEPAAPEGEPEPLFFEPADLQDLTDVVRKLERRPGYHVLAQEAWRQPGFPEGEATPVDLELVARLRDAIAESAEGITVNPSASLPPVPAEGESAGLQEVPLRATATLWLGRYLHLRIEAESHTDTGIGHLDESRRMRSGEIHYFDSPRLGAIAVVVPEQNPVALPDTQVPEEAPPASTGAGSL
jgi:hypothetical protein